MASSLEDLWKDGKEGCLSPLEQCRAWALRETYRDDDVPEKKLYTQVASKLTKIGGGQPTPRAVLYLFEKMDNDDDWYPGKVEEGRGRKPALTELAKGSIKRSAEAINRRGGEVTYRQILGTCPEAVKNPDTNKPVDKKRVYDVFRTKCYDDGAELPWGNRNKLQKSALPDCMIEDRFQFCKYLLRLPHTDNWYYNNLIWVDLCNDIIPKSELMAAKQAVARKSNRKWMSPGSQEFSANLKGDKIHLKQNSSDTYRIWWMPVLMKGRLHIEVFNAEFPGETVPGAQIAAEKLRPILNLRFKWWQSKPKFVFTDKGKAFYHSNSKITEGWKDGLKSSGLKPFMGDDNPAQCAMFGDVLLHETAVSWVLLFFWNEEMKC